MKKIGIAILLLCLSGCSMVRVEATRSARGYCPVIPVEKKPVLLVLTPEQKAKLKEIDPDVMSVLTGNSRTLLKDSLKLRDAVRRYNIWAEIENERTRKALGLATPQFGGRENAGNVDGAGSGKSD